MIELLTSQERGFETAGGGLGRWTTWIDTPVLDSTFGHSGSGSCKWTATTGTTTGILISCGITMGSYVYISWNGWIYSSRAQGGVYVYMRHSFPGGAGYEDYLPIFTTGPTWKPFSGINVLQPGTTSTNIYIYNTGSVVGDNNWIDDLSITLFTAPKITKVWDGAAWKPNSPKVWSGSEWI